MKIIEREYITILGIFAAIILAFVGTFTFSTSVLNNVGNTPLFSLLIISSVIGCVFYKIIFLLIDFICKLNNKDILSNNRKNNLKIFILGFLTGIILILGFLISQNWTFIKKTIIKLIINIYL